MVSSNGGECMEEFGIIAGLTFVQVYYAAHGVFLSHLLSIGLDPLFLMFSASFTTAIILSPFGTYFERSLWPKEFRPMLLTKLTLMAIGGVGFQGLMMLGLMNTSPAIASATPDLAPGMIFVIAGCLRLEKVDLKCIYTRSKIIGTLTCLTGSLCMSFFHGPRAALEVATHEHLLLSNVPIQPVGNSMIIGCICLFAAVVVMSLSMVLQAATLGEFPAPLTLSAVSSLIGSIVLGLAQLLQQGTISSGSHSLSVGYLLGLILLGGAGHGLCVAIVAWSVTKKGPLLVSLFSPVGTVISAVLSALTLGDGMTLGSIMGMLLLFAGFYLVLWAKKREVCSAGKFYDAEEPLLG